MLKKLIITSLLVGASVLGFAQDPSAETKASAKTVVENSQIAMLKKMDLKLKGGKEKVKFPNKFIAQQFLFQENLIDTILVAKSHGLKDVFEKLCAKTNVPTEFKFEGINVGSINYKIYSEGKKQGQADTNVVIVPISFQTHTIAKDNVSDVKYKVTIKWEVKGEKATPVSSSAEPINYLTSERMAMLNAAKDKIIEWYANLPQTLDKQYSEQSISEIQPVTVTKDDIKADLPAGQNFTINNVKDVVINIDPYQFISESDKNLYTNPSASLTITPSFIVTVGDSFKNADIKVEYSAKEPVKPTSDKEKVARRDAAESTISKLAQELSSYVSVRNAEQKERVENLFNSKESNIEVSYLRQNGTERINTKTADKYLSLLKGSSLNFIDHSIELQDPNWETLVVVVNQDFKSKTYSDYTQKKVYLTYDDENKTYIIDKIEVVPNSTKKQ